MSIEVEEPSANSLGGYKAGVTRRGLGLTQRDLHALAMCFGFDHDVDAFEEFAILQQAKANMRAKERT